MKKLLFVCNPYAGKSQIRRNLSEILDVFIKSGYRTEIHLTQAAGDATRMVSENAADFDRVVCGGGDGTLNEVVSGMMQLPWERRPVLGYIPAGTQNDFAKSMGIPFSCTSAARIACGEETCRIDVGRLNESYFVYVCGFGAFTEVSYETPQDIKKLLGVPAYGLEAVKSFIHLKPYRLTIRLDGQEVRDEFMIILVGNSGSVGGMKGIFGDSIALDDGLFEVFVVRRPSSLTAWNDVIGNVFQDRGDNASVQRFKARKLEFISEEKLKWVKDGEHAGDLDHVLIENLQQAVEIASGKPRR